MTTSEKLPTPIVEAGPDALIMSFDDASLQSHMRINEPNALDLDYSKVMMAFALVQPQPERILMVGLGGGSMAKYCRLHWPRAHIKVVELNPEVIAQREAFHVPLDDDLFQVVCAEGGEYMARATPASFDVILVDGFGVGGQQPESLSSLAFYKACRKALKPSGVLMVNLQDVEPLCSRLIGRIWQQFGEPVLPLEVPCGGNLIVMASDESAFQSLASELRARWKALTPEHRETLGEDLLLGLQEELQPWMPIVKSDTKSSSKGRRKR